MNEYRKPSETISNIGLADNEAIGENDYVQRLRNVPQVKLPLIDLGEVENASDGELDVLGSELKSYLNDLGFFAITNHGVLPEVLINMRSLSLEYFNLSLEDKMKNPVDRHERGYSGLNVEVNDLTEGSKRRNDLNEAFNFGVSYPENDPNRISGRRLYAKNNWPREIKGFEEGSLEYLSAMEKASKLMLPLWAKALGLPANFLIPYFDRPHSYVRTIHYPVKVDLEDDDLGIRPHEDTSFVTLQPAENEPGLQLINMDGEWVWPVYPEDSILVYPGMFLEEITNGTVCATEHRVIPPTNKSRYSLAFFMAPNLEASMSRLPNSAGESDNLWAEKTWWHFHTDLMSRTYPRFAAFENEI
tara:strand:+ start:16739 stop:17815 length:1077 start_codon:yes stop_codon:yes gene_type:complete